MESSTIHCDTGDEGADDEAFADSNHNSSLNMTQRLNFIEYDAKI